MNSIRWKFASEAKYRAFKPHGVVSTADELQQEIRGVLVSRCPSKISVREPEYDIQLWMNGESIPDTAFIPLNSTVIAKRIPIGCINLSPLRYIFFFISRLNSFF